MNDDTGERRGSPDGDTRGRGSSAACAGESIFDVPSVDTGELRTGGPRRHPRPADNLTRGEAVLRPV
jgi:hypothetical protein